MLRFLTTRTSTLACQDFNPIDVEQQGANRRFTAAVRHCRLEPNCSQPALTISRIALAACCLAVSFTGCARMFNNSIDDLVPTPPTRQKIDSQFDEFSDLTTDPLFNQAAAKTETDREIETADKILQLDQIQSMGDLPAFPLSPVDNTESDPGDAVPVHDPVNKAPIILKAIQTGDSAPDIVGNELDELPELNSIPDTAQQLKAISLPQTTGDFSPEIDRKHSLSPIPVNETPTKPVGDQTNFVPKKNLQPEARTKQLIEFVSSQMQNLIPPFANHPMESMCIDDSCFDHGSISTSLPTIIAEPEEPELGPIVLVAPDEHPLGKPEDKVDFVTTVAMPPVEDSHVAEDSNSFVGQLIASAADLESSPTIDTQSAELPAEPFGTLVSAPKEPAPAKLTWQSQLEKTIEVFENEIDYSDSADVENLESGLTLLKALQTNLNPGSNTPEELRKFWTHQIEAINKLLSSSTSESSQTAASTALEQLHRAVHELQAIAHLSISATAFCNKVSGFGQYTPFDEAEFGPRQSVLVYCEIENFAPLLETADGVTTYQTRLSSAYLIKDSDGVIVQQQDFPVVTDHARNLRRDFYMHLPVTFADLKPGAYKLQVNIRDHGSEKSATLDQALEFTIR